MEVPVLITVAWLSAVEAPVETAVSMLVSEDTAVLSTVARDKTVETPTVAVESEAEVRSQMLFSVDTWALVEPVVVFDWAVLSRVASEVTPDTSVESD
jgi:hypothetical protein